MRTVCSDAGTVRAGCGSRRCLFCRCVLSERIVSREDNDKKREFAQPAQEGCSQPVAAPPQERRSRRLVRPGMAGNPPQTVAHITATPHAPIPRRQDDHAGLFGRERQAIHPEPSHTSPRRRMLPPTATVPSFRPRSRVHRPCASAPALPACMGHGPLVCPCREKRGTPAARTRVFRPKHKKAGPPERACF